MAIRSMKSHGQFRILYNEKLVKFYRSRGITFRIVKLRKVEVWAYA